MRTKTLVQVWGVGQAQQRALAVFAEDGTVVWKDEITKHRLTRRGLPGLWIKPGEPTFFAALDQAYAGSTLMRVVIGEPSISQDKKTV